MSSSTITTPEPRVSPAARVSSKVSGTSRSAGAANPPAAPPSSTAWSGRPPATPPARASSSPSVVPNGTSYTPGTATLPDRQNSFGPVEPSVPVAAYVAPPCSRIGSTFTRVSTLFTSVG